MQILLLAIAVCASLHCVSGAGRAPSVASMMRLENLPVNGRQHETSPDMVFDPSTPYTLPAEIFNFLERNNWGDFHTMFHLTRKYYVIGSGGRRFIDSQNVLPAPFQEGEPNNGLEFLAMHGAMIEYLTKRFGNLPVTNDPEGLTTVAAVLRGWDTDDKVISGLIRFGGDANTFKRGLVNINNFAQFATEDEFGLFIQTGMRLAHPVDPKNPFKRSYTNDVRAGAGVHNWLHGQLMDDSSKITVGDPRTNLPNILFWRIHGWINFKWQQFQQAHNRTKAEKALYNGFMKLFRKHMTGMASFDDRPSSRDLLEFREPRSRQQDQESRDRDRLIQSERRVVARAVTAPIIDAEADAIQAEALDKVDVSVASQAGNARSASGRRPRKVYLRNLAKRYRSRFFRNHVYTCRHLADKVTTINCFRGRNTRQDVANNILRTLPDVHLERSDDDGGRD